MSDYAAIIGDVARELLGEPNRHLSSRTELRFGHRGSLSVDLTKGTWFDHEANEGGGVVDLLKREDIAEPHEWLKQHGFEEDPRPRTNGPGPHIVETYDYVDEQGELLFQVCRFEPKDFRQR